MFGICLGFSRNVMDSFHALGWRLVEEKEKGVVFGVLGFDVDHLVGAKMSLILEGLERPIFKLHSTFLPLLCSLFSDGVEPSSPPFWILNSL